MHQKLDSIDYTETQFDMNKVLRIIEKSAVRPAMRALLHNKSYCAILCLHRVANLDQRRLLPNDHLKISAGFLERLIQSFKSEGYSFISMDEVCDNIKRKRRFNKNIALTFDDGYANVFTNGYPVLKSENVPATVYIATGLSSGDGILWWDVIEDALLENSKISLPDGRLVDISTKEAKTRLFMELRDWVFSLPVGEIKSKVAKLCGFCEERILSYRNQMASDDTLRSFASDRLLSLGCHTHRHIPCGLLSDSEVCADISESLRRLNLLGVRPLHFAFPYGLDEKNPKRFSQFFMDVGFSSCVTTCSNVVTSSSDPYFLPRVTVKEYGGFTAENIFDVRYNAVKDRVAKYIKSRKT